MIVAVGGDNHGFVVAGFDALDKVLQGGIAAFVGAAVVLGQAQNFLHGGYHIVRRQRRAVMEGNAVAQIEKPGFAAVGIGIALRQAVLRLVLIVDGHEPFIHQIRYRHEFPFHRGEGIDAVGGHGDDAQVQRVVGYIFCLRRRGQAAAGQHQRAEQRQLRTHPGNNVDNRCHRRLPPFRRSSGSRPWEFRPASTSGRRLCSS